MTRKILVVEDSPTQAERLRLLLEGEGYEVEVAEHGRQGLQKVHITPPHLIISDVLMPEMDGYAFCQAIKTDARTRHIPVVLLTWQTTAMDIIEGLMRGADNFIPKSYEDDYLLERVRGIVRNLELREDRHPEMEVTLRLGDRDVSISADKLQIFELLFATVQELGRVYTALQGREHDLVAKTQELEKANRELEEQIRRRNEAQEALRKANEELEERVRERTAELAMTNAELRAEITQRKQVEEALRAKDEELRSMTQALWQAGRLATLGELAASVAHELNNPLGTVSLRLEGLLEQAPANDPQRRGLEIIEREVERMASLVSNLLQFSRRSTKQISTLDIREEIENTLELIHYHLRNRRIAVVREVAPELPKLQADRQQLRQLFLNLFTNAADAMPSGGTLTLRVCQQAAGSEQTAAGEESSRQQAESSRQEAVGSGQKTVPSEGFPLPAASCRLPAVVIEVCDTGVGIAPEDLPKVVEPFFTTKPEGKGTGLGLPICRRIVQEHQGTLELTSEVGKGTTVRITLPISNGANAAHLRGTR